MFTILSCITSLLCLVLSLMNYTNAVTTQHNVNHIFNTIHSSMRQWGSSLNYNGVSFFRAEIPKGVQLHHGGAKPDRIEGMEWLAFEPEHAMNFALKRCDGDKDLMAEEFSSISPKWWLQQAVTGHFPAPELDRKFLGPQRPMPGPPICLEPGWFHTYASTRDLTLIYIDGLSAAKTDRGTLDSQDFVLLWNRSVGNDPHDPLGEMNRARGLCELAQDEFEGKVDGFIRMEHGFEIIMCDFSVLEVVSIFKSSREIFAPSPIGRNPFDEFSFFRAITSRYLGIGGHRVQIDYDNFVTAFNHPEIDLWSDGHSQPRLNKISNATASKLLYQVKQMILSDRKPVEEKLDWQSIADMYVNRYARAIQNLNLSSFDTANATRDEIHRLLQPYLNFTQTNGDAIIKRCREAYIPRHLVNHPNPSLGQQVIEQSMHHFCSYLHMILVDRPELELQKSHLRLLMDTMKWTTWKDCQPGCAVDEICFTAIWPFGTQGDHDKPSCLNATAISGRFGYWN